MEVTILYSIWSITIFSVLLIPRKRINEASIIFLFMQLLAWFLGLVVAELDLIEYPVREFASVNRTSFTFEFLAYPVITVFFVLFYPSNRSFLKRVLYSSIITTILIISEIIFEKYTRLINYNHWKWYYSWLSVYATMQIVRLFHKWFFKFAK